MKYLLKQSISATSPFIFNAEHSSDSRHESKLLILVESGRLNQPFAKRIQNYVENSNLKEDTADALYNFLMAVSGSEHLDALDSLKENGLIDFSNDAEVTGLCAFLKTNAVEDKKLKISWLIETKRNKDEIDTFKSAVVSPEKLEAMYQTAFETQAIVQLNQ